MFVLAPDLHLCWVSLVGRDPGLTQRGRVPPMRGAFR